VTSEPTTRYLLVGVAALSFSARTATFKFLAPYIPVVETLFFLNLIALIAVLPFMYRRENSPSSPAMSSVMLRALAESGALILAYILLRYFHTVEVTLFSNWGPLFVPILGLLWAKKRFSVATTGGLVVGWIGLVIMVLGGDVVDKALGVACGLLGALVLISSMRLALSENPAKVFYYSHLIPAVLFFLIMPFSWTVPTPVQWVLFLVVGVLTALMELLLVLSCRCGSAYPLHPFFYIAVLFSLTIDYFTWDFFPSIPFIVSTVLIIAGCSSILYGTCRRA